MRPIMTFLRQCFQCFALFALTWGLVSCQTLGFYSQAIGGQMEILRKSRPIGPILKDPATDPVLRRQLASVEQIRTFACDHLELPGDESYGRYADLGREHVTWVLFAAPEFSLEPKTWWYPTLGRLDYRGFFREEDTEALAGQLRVEGLDVQVGGVDAYSTLGWFHDPVLNTFVHNTDIDLAELIFHELTHRKLFRGGDTMFNESLANAVAEEGVRRWLKHGGASGGSEEVRGAAGEARGVLRSHRLHPGGAGEALRIRSFRGRDAEEEGGLVCRSARSLPRAAAEVGWPRAGGLADA